MDGLTPRDERIATFARRARAVAAVALVALAFRDVPRPPGAPPQAVAVAAIVGQLLAINAWSLWRSRRGDHGERRQLTEVALELVAATLATTIFGHVVVYQAIPPYLMIAALHAALRLGLRRGVSLTVIAAAVVALARAVQTPPWAIPPDVDPGDVGTWFPLMLTLPMLAALVGWAIDSVEAAEARLLDAHAALERSNRALAGFARAIAHDLRAPLTAAAGTAELVRDRGAQLPQAQLEQLVDTLARSARRASDLVTDMLEASEGTDERDRLVVSDLRAWLLGLVGPVAAERGGRVRVTGTANGAHVPLGAVRGIALNLVTNSLKHTRQDVAPDVRLTVEARPHELVLAVDDNGPGIPEAERAAVLTGGYRGMHADAQGSGLGLAEVDRIVREELAGTITIGDSSLGGARVEVTLPVHPGMQ